MELLQKAIEASKQRERKQQIEQEKLKKWLADHTIKEFKRIFGEMPTVVEIVESWAIVSHKGMDFQATRFYNTVNLRMYGICPECGSICTSGLIRDLADVGDLLRDFEPGSHICRRLDEGSVRFRKRKHRSR